MKTAAQDLATGEAHLLLLLRQVHAQQARAVAGQLVLHGDPEALPDLTPWVKVTAQVVTPVLERLWRAGMAKSGKGKALPSDGRGEADGAWATAPAHPLGRFSVLGSGGRSYLEPLAVGKGVMPHATSAEPGLQNRLSAGGLLYVTKAAAPGGGDDPYGLRVRDAVDAAALQFCRETNVTATAQLKQARVKLRELLRKGLNRGDALHALAAAVQKVFADPARAYRIAHTESRRALYGGQLMVAKEQGYVRRKRWVGRGGCPRCRKLHGKTVKLDTAFHVDPGGGAYAVVQHPPLHPFCNCDLEDVL